MRDWHVLTAVSISIAVYQFGPIAAFAVNHNETTNGDLSNSGNAPTSLNLFTTC